MDALYSTYPKLQQGRKDIEFSYYLGLKSEFMAFGWVRVF